MILYNIGIYLVMGVVRGGALLSRKLNAFVQGRKKLFSDLKTNLQAFGDPIIWVHCASLGEFEQGRPIIEQLKQALPHYRILLTFFSPSGYEPCKSYDGADIISYLPWDISSHVKKFVALVNPKLVLFIKYEFWFNIVREIQHRNIPLILVSAVFRKNQFFFRPYGFFFRPLLRGYNHFFVQDKQSKQLLHSFGINRVTLSGDSRVDRVYQIAQQHDHIPVVERFAGTHCVFIAGSCWPEDLDLLMPFINAYRDQMKFIIAPHEIGESFLAKIECSLPVASIRYTKAGQGLETARVLLIDNIGLLSRLYRYGKFAYIGGGLGKGLHNILEAACFGIPIFFGKKNYQKFKEALDLTLKGGAFAIGNANELAAHYEVLAPSSSKYRAACKTTQEYVQENGGATDKVVAYCKQVILKA